MFDFVTPHQIIGFALASFVCESLLFGTGCVIVYGLHHYHDDYLAPPEA